MNQLLIPPRYLCPLLCLALLAGCETTPGSSSPSSPSPAGAATLNPLVPLDPNGFEQVWRGNSGLGANQHVTGIYAIEDSIYIYIGNDTVETFDKDTGVLRYTLTVQHTRGDLPRPPVVFKDKVVIPTDDTLEVYRRTTGDFVTSVPLGFRISTNVSGISDLCCMGVDVSGGRLELVDINRPYHFMVWALVMGGTVTAAPATANGAIYCATAGGGIRSLSIDRESNWFINNDNYAENDQYNTGATIDADLAADSSGVYAANEAGRLVCLDKGSGHLHWQYLSPVGLDAAPILSKTVVYQPLPGKGIIAFAKDQLFHDQPGNAHLVPEPTHEPIWRCDEAKQVISDDDNYVYCTSVDHHLIAVDKTNGTVVFRSPIQHLTAFAHNGADSTIYAVSEDDGSVWAFKPVVRPGIAGFLSADQ